MGTRRASRIDANQSPLVDLLRDCGAFVIVTSHVGKGFPDAIVLWRSHWYLVEFKDGKKSPSRRKLTEDQVKLHDQVTHHGGRIYVLESERDALQLLGGQIAA